MQPHLSFTSKEILTMASSLSELKIKFLFSFINVIVILDIANLKDIIEALKKVFSQTIAGLLLVYNWVYYNLLCQPLKQTIEMMWRVAFRSV